MRSRITDRLKEKLEGGVVGLLVGDALGVPYEFHPPHQIPPLAQIEFEPPEGFQRSHSGVVPGTWSDDGADGVSAIPERWRTLLRGADLYENELQRLISFRCGANS